MMRYYPTIYYKQGENNHTHTHKNREVDRTDGGTRQRDLDILLEAEEGAYQVAEVEEHVEGLPFLASADCSLLLLLIPHPLLDAEDEAGGDQRSWVHQ